MAFQFQGEQICSGCAHKYEWVTTQLERNDFVNGLRDRMWKNVKKCTQINQTSRYSIEIACPQCGKRELIEKEKCELPQ